MPERIEPLPLRRELYRTISVNLSPEDYEAFDELRQKISETRNGRPLTSSQTLRLLLRKEAARLRTRMVGGIKEGTEPETMPA